MPGREGGSERHHGAGLVDRLADGLRRTAEALERAARVAIGRPEAGGDALHRELHADHEEILGLFDELGDPDHDQVPASWAALRDVLRAHARAEDEIVYTRLIDEPQTRDAVLHARGEHREIERLVDEIDLMPPGSDPFHERMGELHQLVRHHLADEESDLLIEAARALPEHERAALADRFRELEALLRSSIADELPRAVGGRR